MLIVALVLAVIGLAALVTAVVTSNELVAWVCIAASVLGVILLIVDAIRERQGRVADEAPAAPVTVPDEPEPEPEDAADADAVAYSEEEPADSSYSTFDADYPDDSPEQEVAAEDHPEEVVTDDPESDVPDDDEPELPEPAEEAALHTVDENEPPADEDDDLEADEDAAAADQPDKG
jgi:hypothetical protein